MYPSLWALRSYVEKFSQNLTLHTPKNSNDNYALLMLLNAKPVKQLLHFLKVGFAKQLEKYGASNA